MKKIIIAMAAVAAAFTMASCNKEQTVSPDENPTVGKSVITASIENGLTKAHLDANGDDTDGYKVFWSEGDDLIVGGGLDEMGEYKNWVAEYKLEDSSAGSSQGTFSWQAENNTFISIDKECHEPSFEEGNMYMAIHPFDLIDMNTGAFTWRTEQTYNGTTGYIPMIAAAEVTEDGTADFIFTNLGGLLRLTVKGTATIKSITVKAKEPMSGEIDYFAMDEDGNIVALMGNDDRYETYNYINLDCGESGVALSSTGTDFYISMPCHYSVSGDDISLGGYSEVTITLTDMKDNICEKNLSSNKQLVIERSKITPATFTASEFKAPVPEGALPGKFTVNASGKQVNFSQGNLYADSDNALHFEANQYAFKSSYIKSHVSHFTWSSTVAAAVGESNSGDNLFCDEDNKVSVDGSEAIYYALSTEEWQYLFNNHSKQWATVNGVNGYVIAPDGFAETLADTYADDAALAADNLVFLPAAGSRDDSDVYGAGGIGYYWSSAALDSGSAYGVSFYSSDVSPDSSGCRNFGCSVRLVTDCE